MNFLRSLSFLVCCSLFAAAPSLVWAQDAEPDDASRIAISDEQHALNEEAVQAIFDEDYVRAISLLKESLIIGELNITYLNLGRAYQKAERCAQALKAYKKALTAPPVKQPSPEIIETQTRRYMEEMQETCPVEESAELENNLEEDAPTEIDTPAENEKPQVAQADSSGRSSKTLGWAATITGAVLIGGGVGMHFIAESERADLRDPTFDNNGIVVGTTQADFERAEQKANTYDNIGLSMGIVGGLAAATGVYLLLTSNSNEAPTTAGFWVSDGGGGISWSTRF